MSVSRSFAALSIALGTLAVSLSACPRPEPDGAAASTWSARAIAPSAPSASAPASPRSDTIQLPRQASGRVPFVLWLHGLGSSGGEITQGLGVVALADQRRFAWAAPNGALDSQRRRYWNASPACCNFDQARIDHVAELGRLISAAREHPAIDPKRVYVIGFSNGGFMAHRLACERPGITAIASIAGAGPHAQCAPADPVAVLQVHGDADRIVPYAGGRALGSPALAPHASALETARGWAARNRCRGLPKSGSPLDINEQLSGSETAVSVFGGCASAVELWTVRGGDHFAALERRALESILAFLEKQERR